MTIPRFSDIRIPALWFSWLALLLAAVSIAAGAPAKKPKPRKPARKTAVAKPKPKPALKPSDPLAAGIRAAQDENHAEAIRILTPLLKGQPKLADYIAFHLAKAHYGQRDFPAARATAQIAAAFTPASPYRDAARIIAARSLTAAGKPTDALRELSQYGEGMPQPNSDFAIAEAHQQTGAFDKAAFYYQRVYYGYPASDQARDAEAALVSLRDQLGAAYPPVPASDRLGRARALLDARRYADARADYEAIRDEVTGADRDVALTGIGAADYLSGKQSQACRYLESIEIRDDEADAERLYYLYACARARDDSSRSTKALEALEKSHKRSPWRLKALVAAANRLLVVNDTENYLPLYRDCAKDFPGTAEAAYCHWKVTWQSYLNRKRDAGDRLREHLTDYPRSIKASSALYFLGRLAEKSKDFGAARVYYERLEQRFPGYYYAHLARERLAQTAIARAANDTKALQFADRLDLPLPREPLSFAATRESSTRIERARLLKRASLDDLAVAELRYGARNGSQPHVLAMELAREAGEPPEALRLMKATVRDYFAMAPTDAPEQFWQYLFPLPYRESLLAEASRNALDPHMVAGLIRQESEFNPRAVSRAKAYGLTQILPSTGRQLARRAGVRGFRTTMLFQPAINLKLGTIYLRSLLDQWNGRWEETLASYNAGKSRVDEWLTWGNFEEPVEFVETIPFTETRDYVQAVIRNAHMYRHLYGDADSKTARR